MTTPKVVVAGHCTIDNIHHADGRELPCTFGGAAAYASLGASMAGADVTLLTLVGEDYPLIRLEEGLRADGRVNTAHVRALPGRSVHNEAWYAHDGGRRFEIEDWERMETLTPTVADLEQIDRVDLVLVAAASLWQQSALIDELERWGCRVAFDTELHYFEAPELQDELLRLIPRVSYFLPSIEHLERLFGFHADHGSYADILASLGCAAIVLKRGSRGSVLFDFDGDNVWSIPALDGLSVADTTGAGDAFDGGFLAALARGDDLVDAACWGTVAASFVVESIGARTPEHFDPRLAAARLDRVRSRVEETAAIRGARRTVER